MQGFNGFCASELLEWYKYVQRRPQICNAYHVQLKRFLLSYI